MSKVRVDEAVNRAGTGQIKLGNMTNYGLYYQNGSGAAAEVVLPDDGIVKRDGTSLVGVAWHATLTPTGAGPFTLNIGGAPVVLVDTQNLTDGQYDFNVTVNSTRFRSVVILFTDSSPVVQPDGVACGFSAGTDTTVTSFAARTPFTIDDVNIDNMLWAHITQDNGTSWRVVLTD